MDIYSVMESRIHRITLDSELIYSTTVFRKFLCNKMVKSQEEKRRRSKRTNVAKTPTEPLAIKRREYLSLFSKAAKKPDRRNKMVDMANAAEIRAVSECIQNLLEGNVAIDSKVLRQMKKYKTLLRSLAMKCYPLRKKKRILKQKGGFIGALIPLAISAATSLLPSLISSFAK